MPQQRLYMIINYTNSAFNFRNTECPTDNRTILPNSVTLTSGSGDGCSIPDCSDQKYFAGHHMEITDTSNHQYYIWNLDDTKSDHECYYSTTTNFNDGKRFNMNFDNDGCKKVILVKPDYSLEMFKLH